MPLAMPTNPPPAGVPPKEAIEYFRAKALKPAFDYRDTWREEHATAFSVAKATSLDILGDIRAGLDAALAEGKPFAQFKKELTPLLQAKGWWGRKDVVDPKTGETVSAQLGSPRRLRTIYESNIRTALAAGHWEKAQRTKRALPYFIYQLGPSERHRPEHVALEGTMLPVDDPFWNTHYPPNGWGCKCWLRQITKYEYDKLSSEGVPAQGDPVLDPQGRPTGRIRSRTIPAKTTAPQITLRPWRNTRTGQIEQVPQGIDPGWDTNPGKSRHSKANQLLSTKQEVITSMLSKPVREKPVSASIQLPKSPTGKMGKSVLQIIDEVHDDGALPRIPLKPSKSNKYLGAYYHDNAASSYKIEVKNNGPWPELTMVHEIGHFIDHQALGNNTLWASVDSPLLEKWRSLVLESNAVQNLRTLVNNATTKDKKSYYRYFLSIKELWARSYAQYIAQKSSNPTLVSQLDKARKSEENRQWSEDDFQPIMDEIDAIFKAKGWIK